MKYCYIFIMSLFVSFNIAKSQDLSAKRIATIKSFTTALFHDNKSPKFIIDNYMHLPLNDTISLQKREGIISILMDSLKKKHIGLVSSSGCKIVSYDKFKGEKKKFSGSSQDIVIVTVHNEPVIYFYFHEDKISSFSIIEKGKYGYFILI